MATGSNGFRQQFGRSTWFGTTAQSIIRNVRARRLKFESSNQYWEDRYLLGLDSGSGSYGRLAEFKSETLNSFVKDHGVETVVEWGCGDGAQLALAHYPDYTGVDVSARAIQLCRAKFGNDQTKRFLSAAATDTYGIRADLALSLDVIYHLVEDAVYDEYMTRLIASSRRFVCIYSSNSPEAAPVPHVRHRVFTDWMANNAPSWELFLKVNNPFPQDRSHPDQTSWSDFYFFRKQPDGSSD